MYIAHTVPGRYTLKPLSLVLYLEEEELLLKLVLITNQLIIDDNAHSLHCKRIQATRDD